LVDVTAGINLSTGLVTWTFTSLDPTTLDLTSIPLAGFLPPDKTPPEGEGFVSYTIEPKANLSTGATINAQATVVFDQNAPINTPSLTNTIDASAPTSTVNALPATTSQSTFTVSWSGSDPGGSGIASYNVFVSDDAGPFLPFQTDTTATSALFTGVVGHTYGFYSVAVSNVGVAQPAPTSAQATTQVVLPPPPPLVTMTHVQDVMNKKHQVTEIIVTFSGAVNATEADALTTYRLATPGKKGSYTAKNAAVIKLKKAVYTAAGDKVTLTPKKPFALTKPVQLRVYAELPHGLEDSLGRFINGGIDDLAVLTKKNVIIDAVALARVTDAH
jgi:hypothetical protein